MLVLGRQLGLWVRSRPHGDLLVTAHPFRRGVLMGRRLESIALLLHLAVVYTSGCTGSGRIGCSNGTTVLPYLGRSCLSVHAFFPVL